MVAAYGSTSASDSTRSLLSAERSRGAGTIATRLGWQPSRFLTDRAEAEHAFQLAEQLGSVNAAATELGTTWPSLRKAFTRPGSACQRATRTRAIRQGRLLAITATLATAVVLLLMTGVVRPVWVVPAWNSQDQSDSEEERVTQQMAPTLP